MSDLRIVLEVSHSFQTGLHTGIQRVVRETIRTLNDSKIPYKLIWHPYGSNLSFYDITEVYNANKFNEAQRIILKIGSTALVNNSQIFRKIYRMARGLPWAKKIMDRLRLVRLTKLGVANYTPNESDHILLLDVYWNDPSLMEKIQKICGTSTPISVFVHDVFPISNPEWFEDKSVKLFAKSFFMAVSLSKNIITSSQSNVAMITRVIGNASINIPVVQFGTDHLPKSLPRSLYKKPTGLIWVGTIEPRKNLVFLLDLIEQHEVDFSLLVIGRNGWKSRDEINRLNKLRDLGKLSWESDASDVFLSNAINESFVGLITSHNEGFGFSVHEFLARDLPVVAPRIPVFEEINNPRLNFYSPNNHESLLHAISIAMSGSNENNRYIYKRSWITFTEELIKSLK